MEDMIEHECSGFEYPSKEEAQESRMPKQDLFHSKGRGSKRRKSVKSRVVRVVDGNLKGDSRGQPSDSWAWRKYGQKPIKGSPYPRSYYRCSSFKGCPAKKQVERSQTEPSIFIVSYTSDHNHPWQPRAETNKKLVSEEASSELDQNNTFILSSDHPLLSSMAIINQVVEEEVVAELSSMQWGPSIKEEDHFFADLEELPEYSTIFSRGHRLC